MDIFTERGQVYKNHADAAIRLFNRRYKHTHSVYSTHWQLPIPVDGVMVNHSAEKLSGFVEVKCRELDLASFRSRFSNEWLVTYDKLINAQKIARTFGVPLFGFLYLIHERVLLAKRLTDENGNLTGMRIEKTRTKATCNGGEAERVNAFIDMQDATEIRAGICE